MHAGGAEQGRHDWVGDLRFDEVGAALPPRVDDDLRVAEVGQRVERHVPERPGAGERGGAGEQQDQEAMPDRDVDDALDHGVAPVRVACCDGSASNCRLQWSEQKWNTCPPCVAVRPARPASPASTGIPHTGS